MANILQNIQNTNGLSLNNTKTEGVKLYEEMFKILSVREWLQRAENLPPLKVYLSELFSEGDVVMLFAEPNAGKSLLLVQLGQHIASGTSLTPFVNVNPPQVVIYFDFELNPRQFFARYNGVKFSPNFYRGELNPDFESNNFEQDIIKEIERQVLEKEAKVIIIDNLTWLLNESEKGSEAGKLMKGLQKLKNRLNISIIVAAHTPKRNGSDRLTLNDLAGSSRLGNFTTAAIAIGKSIKDEGLRYVKCVKTRNFENNHGSENVAIFQLANTGEMLGLEFIGYDREANHLFELPEQKRLEETEAVNELFTSGITQREIAKTLGLSLGKVNYILKKNKK